MTAWFIRRPIGTTLLLLSIAVAGMLGYRELPIGNIPEVEFPTLVITATAADARGTAGAPGATVVAAGRAGAEGGGSSGSPSRYASVCPS